MARGRTGRRSTGPTGAAALPGQGGQAGGAVELVEACPALRNRWNRLRHIWGRGSASAGILGHEEPLLVVRQAAKRGAPVSQQPSSLFLYCFPCKTAATIALQFSVKLSRLGEWCRMFKSLQLPLTA